MRRLHSPALAIFVALLPHIATATSGADSSDCPPFQALKVTFIAWNVSDTASNCSCTDGYEPSELRDDASYYKLLPKPGGCSSSTTSSTCRPCPPGFHKNWVGDHVCQICPAATYSAKCGAVECTQSPPGTWSHDGSTHYNNCPAHTYSTKGVANTLACSMCPANSNSSEKSTTLDACICLPGFFGKPNASDNYIQRTGGCYPCPVGAVCVGGSWPNWPKPLAGYYNVSEALRPDIIKKFGVSSIAQVPVHAQFAIAKCHSPDACLGDDYCRNGHSGMLCHACEPGRYRKEKDDTCEVCPDKQENLQIIVLVAIILVAVCYILTRFVLIFGRGSRPIYAIILKIMWSYLFLNGSAFRAANIAAPSTTSYWGESAVNFLKTMSIEQRPQQALMSVDCMFADLYGQHGFANYNVKHQDQLRAAFAVAAPIGILCLVYAFALVLFILEKMFRCCWRHKTLLPCFKWLKHRREAKTGKLPDDEEEDAEALENPIAVFVRRLKGHIPHIIVFWFFLQPILVYEYAKGFFCVELTPAYPDALFNRHDFDRRCDDWQLIRWLSLGGFAFWCIGIPVFFAIVLHLNRLDLRENNMVKNWGFLYTGYEADFYYWEAVIFLRKAVILLVGGIPGLEVNQQITFLLVAGTIFLSIQIVVGPYDNRSYCVLDKLETLMLWSFVASLLGPLYLRANDLYPWSGLEEWTNAKYCEDQAVKFLVLATHLRFFYYFFSFFIEDVFPSGGPARFFNGRLKYDVTMKEFDLAGLYPWDREYFCTVLVDMVRAHVEEVTSFTFRWIEAAIKEGCLYIAARRRHHCACLRSCCCLCKKNGVDDAYSDSPGRSPNGSPGSPTRDPTRGAGSPTKRRGNAGGLSDDEKIELEGSQTVGLTQLQLQIMHQAQYPCETFRKDLSKKVKKDNAHPSGLSSRAVNAFTKEKATVERQLQAKAEKAEKKRVATMTDFQNLFTATDSEWTEDEEALKPNDKRHLGAPAKKTEDEDKRDGECSKEDLEEMFQKHAPTENPEQLKWKAAFEGRANTQAFVDGRTEEFDTRQSKLEPEVDFLAPSSQLVKHDGDEEELTEVDRHVQELEEDIDKEMAAGGPRATAVYRTQIATYRQSLANLNTDDRDNMAEYVERAKHEVKEKLEEVKAKLRRIEHPGSHGQRPKHKALGDSGAGVGSL